MGKLIRKTEFLVRFGKVIENIIKGFLELVELGEVIVGVWVLLLL